jgi:gas vesicle protein
MGKGFFKGIALGAVLGSLATIVMRDEHRTEKAKAAKKVADTVQKKVVEHLLAVGKVTKSAFDKVVEATLAEFRDVKELSSDELKELKKEFKDTWRQMHDAMKAK